MPEQENETSSGKLKEFSPLSGGLHNQHSSFNSHARSTNRKSMNLGDIYAMPPDAFVNIPTPSNQSESCSIPETIQKRLPIIADHIEEARAECVRQFITQIFLPRMAIQDPLQLEELVSLTINFKSNFAKKHPKDFVGDFEIITSVEMELMNLYRRIDQKSVPKAWTRLAHLVKRGLYELKDLLDEYPDKLFQV